ncbi:hypothetical protein EVJ58_g9894 [Rhodofomes roseus]|uniref:DUF6532 domain-containing protein n=1 Tax=Rhodofomes roseus TaxID=34475 RepID=A0A4Y9XTB6_9APHY|nr:hypothetical protein EVJ58_g9894 [Rhodofomes roseus]
MQSRSNGRPRNADPVPIYSDDEEMASRYRRPHADSDNPRASQYDDDNEGSKIGNGLDNDLQFDDDQSGNEHALSQFVYDAGDFDEDDEGHLSQQDDEPLERVPSSPRSSSPLPRRSISLYDDVDEEHQEQPRKVPVDVEDDIGSEAEGSSMNGDISCPQLVSTPSKHGPRAKDYDADVKALLNIANSLFRCRVSTIDAFPTDLLEEEWAQICWGEACKTLDVNYAADQRVIKILRGELKSKVRPLVESLYSFNGSSAKKAIRENRDKAVALTSDSAFVYEDPAINQPQGAEAERKGIYRHPIIQKAINATWFVNRSDEGVIFKEFFGPAISIGMIALVLTAVQCCIDEWGTGKHSGVSFYENEYKPIYLSHKENLTAFDDLSDAAHRLLRKLRKKLYKEARFHSGAEDTDRTASTLSRDALTRALQQSLDAGDPDDDDDT